MVNQQKPSKPKVATEEIKLRKDLFPVIKEVKTKNLLCTSCGGSVKDLIGRGTPISHPFLETLLCKKCSTFYGDGQFSEDEDGCDKYCRWCGQGGTLFLCSSCTAGFCKKCVKRNLPKELQTELEKDDWECFCCNPKPIFELRAQCWAAEEYATQYANKSSSSSTKTRGAKSTKKKRGRDSSSDDEVVSRERKRTRSEKLGGSSEEDLEGKKNSDLDEKKGSKITSKKKNEKEKKENGDKQGTPRRTSLRERKTGKVEDEIISGLKIIHWNQAIKKFHDAAGDIAKLTKEMHKKILDFKVKKLNLKHINTDESFDEVHKLFEEYLDILSNTSSSIRESMNNYCVGWKKEAAFEREKVNKSEDSNELDNASTVENGIANDSSEGNKADKLSTAISEAKDSEEKNEETEEKNTKISVDSEKDLNKSTLKVSEEKMDVDSTDADNKESSVSKDSPLKENGDNSIKESINNSESNLSEGPVDNKSDPKEEQVSEEPSHKSNEVNDDSSLKESSTLKETTSSSVEKNDSDNR